MYELWNHPSGIPLCTKSMYELWKGDDVYAEQHIFGDYSRNSEPCKDE